MRAASSPRLASVDALRGLAGGAMLLVNNPGDWGHVYAPLQHADWHGCTPTDLIFPFFLFIVGVSIALSLGARVDAGAAPWPLARGVLEHAAGITLLGLALHALAWWLMNKPEFRLMAVLQRIGLCFAVTGLVAVYLRAIWPRSSMRPCWGAFMNCSWIWPVDANAASCDLEPGLMPVSKRHAAGAPSCTSM